MHEKLAYTLIYLSDLDFINAASVSRDFGYDKKNSNMIEELEKNNRSVVKYWSVILLGSSIIRTPWINYKGVTVIVLFIWSRDTQTIRSERSSSQIHLQMNLIEKLHLQSANTNRKTIEKSFELGARELSNTFYDFLSHKLYIFLYPIITIFFFKKKNYQIIKLINCLRRQIK